MRYIFINLEYEKVIDIVLYTLQMSMIRKMCLSSTNYSYDFAIFKRKKRTMRIFNRAMYIIFLNISSDKCINQIL